LLCIFFFKINQFFQCGLCKSSTCITVHRLLIRQMKLELMGCEPSSPVSVSIQCLIIIKIEAEAGMVYQEYDGKFKLALRNKLMNVRVLVLTAMAI
uniref:Uncharacterized protein n=1 Tax=Glossina palpalis gambiensis TaxID=67801 RepID=A0A1B0BMU5_9MUSC